MKYHLAVLSGLLKESKLGTLSQRVQNKLRAT